MAIFTVFWHCMDKTINQLNNCHIIDIVAVKLPPQLNFISNTYLHCLVVQWRTLWVLLLCVWCMQATLHGTVNDLAWYVVMCAKTGSSAPTRGGFKLLRKISFDCFMRRRCIEQVCWTSRIQTAFLVITKWKHNFPLFLGKLHRVRSISTRIDEQPSSGHKRAAVDLTEALLLQSQWRKDDFTAVYSQWKQQEGSHRERELAGDMNPTSEVKAGMSQPICDTGIPSTTAVSQSDTPSLTFRSCALVASYFYKHYSTEIDF